MQAELLFQKFLHAEGYRWVHRAGAIRTGPIVRAHDIFGALDFLVLMPPDEKNDVWGIQVTSKSGLPMRRKKVASIGWPKSWRVTLATHEMSPDPADGRRTLHWWRTEDLVKGAWKKAVAVAFDREFVVEKFKGRTKE
jgi:hypothetical protein